MATFGVMLPTSGSPSEAFDVDAPIEAARWADRTEFDSVWVGDHIFTTHQILESIVVLSMVAAETTRVRLGPCVLLLPMRQLAVVAKQSSTLAIMSKGRLTLGVGLGGEFVKEWQAAGVPLEERGARLTEGVTLLRLLWGGEVVEINGRFTQLPGVRLQPAPGSIPIVFGGRSPAALRRAALLGDGWIGFLQTAARFGRAVGAIDDIRAAEGLADRPFGRSLLVPFRVDAQPGDPKTRAAEVFTEGSRGNPVKTPIDLLRGWLVTGSAKSIVDQLGAFVDQGCEHFIMHSLDGGPRGRDDLATVARDVIPKLR